jgi:hypothetical protein
MHSVTDLRDRLYDVYTCRGVPYTNWSLCVPAPLCHRCCVVSAKQQLLNCRVIAKLHPSPPLYSEGLGTGMTRLLSYYKERQKKRQLSLAL